MRQYILLVSVLVLCFGLSAVGGAQQPADDDVVKQVLEAWQKRRKAIKTVYYKVEGTEIYPKGSMTDKSPQAHPKLRESYPERDVSLPIQTEYSFDFPNAKIRLERRNRILHQSLGEFCPRTSIQLFDGKRVSLYEPRVENTSDLYTPVDAQPELVLYGDGTMHLLLQAEYPVLFAHGFPPVYCHVGDLTGFFQRPVQASLLRLHERGRIGDRDCVILRSLPEGGSLARSDEFWVDLARDGAILRWQAFVRGVPCIRQELTYQQLDGHWLPQSWQYDLFPMQDGRTVFLRGERLKVSEVVINPSVAAETFTAPRRQGMVVSNSRGGVFVVASDNQTLVPYGQSTRLWRWWHWIGITLACLATAGGAMYWRHRAYSRS